MGPVCIKRQGSRETRQDPEGCLMPCLGGLEVVFKQVLKLDKIEKIVSCHDSEGSKWHSELLSVSSELREKLQDPQFVASRCDLDGSGDLDPYELKQAARVYGISPSHEDHGSAAQQMAGQSRISKEDFANMVAFQSQESTKLIRTIPHSLRGVALGQLLHLEAVFIKSGWLPAACESFNRENARAIENGKKFKQSPNLYSLDTFVVTPMTKPGKCKASEHDHQRTIADATEKSSFSELVNPWGLWVHCFVSHFWGHDFSSTVTALELWADSNYQKMTSEKLSVVFWICLFALNQHNVAEEVGENPQQGPFNAALAQATGGAVMVLDEDIKPFSRIWCLFEISRLKDLQRPFELICTEGSLSKPQTESQAVSLKMLRATCEALWTVAAAKAESSVAADKYHIWAEIVNKSLKDGISGYGAQRFFTSRHYKNGVPPEGTFSDFDCYMKSLLSTAMLQLLMAMGEYAAAAKCCLYGADVGCEQLREICDSFEHEAERRDWLNSLMMKTSAASVVQLLLELGTDAKAADNDGWTALMFAARGGHEAVAKLLLEHGADVNAAANSDGWTALMVATRLGHEAVAKLLLEKGADVNAVRNDGVAALMLAAAGGHEAVGQLLLKHSADVRAASNRGDTALMCAAAGGHEAVCTLLLKNGADVKVAANRGGTALMLAAAGGHEAVSRLLLEHRADVKAVNKDGRTALMCAAAGGHEAVAELLLEHGADVKAEGNDGFTALTLAAAGGHGTVARLLRRHGASRIHGFRRRLFG